MDCLNKNVEDDKSGNPVGHKVKVNTRIHAMTDFEAEASSNMVTGTLCICASICVI